VSTTPGTDHAVNPGPEVAVGEAGRGPSAAATDDATWLFMVGASVGALAHELGNPLMVISASTELILLDPDLPAETREPAERVLAAAQKANRLAAAMREMITLGDTSPAPPRGVSLAACLPHSLLFTGFRLRRLQVIPEVDLPPDLPPVRAHAGQLIALLAVLEYTLATAAAGEESLKSTLRMAASHNEAEGMIEVRFTCSNGSGRGMRRIQPPLATEQVLARILTVLMERVGATFGADAGSGGDAIWVLRLPQA
jgi:signal transduction histidine kinase